MDDSSVEFEDEVHEGAVTDVNDSVENEIEENSGVVENSGGVEMVPNVVNPDAARVVLDKAVVGADAPCS